MRGHIGDYTLVTTLPVLLLSSGSVLCTKARVFVTIELQSRPQYSKRSQLRLLLQYFALKRGPKHKELVIRKRVNYKGTMFLRQRKQVHVKWVCNSWWRTVQTILPSLVSHICKIPRVSRKFYGLPTVDFSKRSLLLSPRCTQTHTLRTE